MTDTSPSTKETPASTSVEQHKKWLVTTGDEIGKGGGKNSGWTSQGRIILEAARHETEPLVVLSLLRYQKARNAKPWADPYDIFQRLETALKECATKGGADNMLTMELMRHLLLYTLRAYTFHSKSDSNGKRSHGD